MADPVIVDQWVGVIGGPLSGSVGNARTRWRSRRSALLILEDDHGYFGFGEAAPLPGYSSETLEDCLNALENFGVVKDLALPPAASFAIETAQLDLICQQEGISIHRLLAENPRSRVKRVGLVDGPPEEWTSEIAALDQRGIRHFKIKVGPTTPIDALRSLPGTIRLDANGTWDRTRLAQCADLGIEFVEQPVPAGELATLGRCAVPWAADESLRTEAEQLLKSPCAAFVLKPAVLGGFRSCLDLARRATNRGIGVMASHLFDGPIALAACCELALSLPGKSLACGVDTHNALAAFSKMDVPQLRSPGEIIPAEFSGLGFSDEARAEMLSWIS